MAKRCLLDFLGVSLLGSKKPSGRIIENFLDHLGGSAQSTIIGYGKKTSVLSAALANGTFGHALDFDDDSSVGAGHLTSCIAPCLLALAEWLNRRGADILLSFVLGYEVGSTLAMTVEPALTRKGWHATSVIGIFASTAAAAKMLDLKRDVIRNAFGVAATQASGLRRNFGTMCKSFHAGKAAMLGVESCLLAQEGFTGDRNIFEGKWGFPDVFSGGPQNCDAIPQEFGTEFFIRKNWFKPYPSCGCTHAAIDAAISLRNQNEIDPMNVEKIEVGVLPIAFDTLVHNSPKTPDEAKFSMPFCVSTALMEGALTNNHFSAFRTEESSLVNLMKSVTMHVDPDLAKEGYRGTFGAVLRITFSDGQMLTKKVIAPRGHPQNPISVEDLISKYRDCTHLALSQELVEYSLDFVMNLEKMNDISPLMKSMKGP
jgi:2-methylcitrate dehydratase PrpD